MLSLKEQENAMKSLIIEAHEGQFYGEQDYVYHLYKVRAAFERMFAGQVTCDDMFLRGVTACYGHDLIEDTWVTKEYLSNARYDIQTIRAIDMCTKKEGLSYTQYLKNIVEDGIAFMVKVSDTYSNLSESIEVADIKRVRKYSKQLEKLYKLRKDFLEG